MNYKFNFSQLVDLENDLKASERAIPAIVAAVMREKFREAKRELAQAVPRESGRLARSLGFSVRKAKGLVTGRLGFMVRRVTPATIIAGNVLQKPGATARKGPYLWIPLPGTSITPTQFRSLPDTFIKKSATGKLIAFQRIGVQELPMFVLKHAVKLSAPPLPLDARGEQAAEQIAEAVPEAIAQVIEAKKTVQRIL